MCPTPGAEIQGLFHSPVSRDVPAFEEIGLVTSNGDAITSNLNICPVLHYRCPPIGSPDMEWHQSTVCLDGVTTLQICQVAEQSDNCLGLLLTYSSGDRECLGQYRFDRYLSQPIYVSHCYYSTKRIKHTYYVSVRGELDIRSSDYERRKFPTRGIICWWFGPNGNSLTINGERMWS